MFIKVHSQSSFLTSPECLASVESCRVQEAPLVKGWGWVPEVLDTACKSMHLYRTFFPPLKWFPLESRFHWKKLFVHKYQLYVAELN